METQECLAAQALRQGEIETDWIHYGEDGYRDDTRVTWYHLIDGSMVETIHGNIIEAFDERGNIIEETSDGTK